jgi:hypothetical protein
MLWEKADSELDTDGAWLYIHLRDWDGLIVKTKRGFC